MKTILTLFLTIFVLAGCMSQKRVVVNNKELPIWYENPMKSTNTTLYAVEQGDNKATAVNRALNEILARLSVSISSEFNTKTEVTRGSAETYNVSSSNEIKARINEIRISNYEIVNANDFGFERYLVQVKVDKRKLFLSLQNELEQKFTIIENEKIQAQNYNAIKKLNTYTKALESLDYINNTLMVMNSLDSNFDNSLLLKKVVAVQNRYDLLLSKISFSINSNKDAKNLKSSISKGLSAKNYKVNNSLGKNHFNIYLSSNTSKAFSYGFNLARSAISITVKDYRGNVVGSNKLNITGQSTQGKKIAKENVAMKLNAILKTNGIAKTIGLDI